MWIKDLFPHIPERLFKMYAILKNIHQSATVDSIEIFLQPFLKGSFFHRKIELRAIKIIQLNDKSGAPIERHALIRVCSDKTRKRLIKILNKQTFRDEQNKKQPVRAAEFVLRQGMNERRNHDGLTIRQDARKHERRRAGLKISPIAEKVYGPSVVSVDSKPKLLRKIIG